MSQTPPTVEARLARLEDQNRRLRGTVVALAGVVIAAVAVGWSVNQAVPNVIEAREFRVINDEGEVATTLAADEGGGVVVVNNAEGKTVISLAADEDGGVVELLNDQGKQVIGFWAEENGSLVRVANAKGQPVIGIGANEEGGLIRVLNAENEQVIRIYADLDGGAVVVRNLATGDTEVYSADGN